MSGPARQPATDAGYGFAAAANIVGMDESKLRYWVQIGLVGTSLRVGGRPRFSFRDLVAVRAARELTARGFSAAQIRAVLAGVQGGDPGDGPGALSRLRVAFDGTALVMVDDAGAFEASGQAVFAFGLDELAARATALAAGAAAAAAPPSAAPPAVAGSVPPAEPRDDEVRQRTLASKRRSSYDWFCEGLELQERSGRDDAAAACYRQALAADPGLAAAHTNLGVIAHRRGDRTGARAAFERALGLDPEQDEARFNLATLLIEAGQLDLGAAELRRVLVHAPDCADAHYNLSSVLWALGSRAQAREHMEAFVRLRRAAPDVPDGDPWLEEARRRLSAA